MEEPIRLIIDKLLNTAHECLLEEHEDDDSNDWLDIILGIIKELETVCEHDESFVITYEGSITE